MDTKEDLSKRDVAQPFRQRSPEHSQLVHELHGYYEPIQGQNAQTLVRARKRLQSHTARQRTSLLTEAAAPRTQPLVIKGEMKKIALAPVAPLSVKQQRRRHAISLLSIAFLALVLIMTVLVATPLGNEVGLRPLQSGSSLFANSNVGPISLVAQVTATALSHQRMDGYDPFAYGAQVVSDGSYSLNWRKGECTYWANFRYHQLTTQYWVPWRGNADQWVAGAQLAHWNVSTVPHVPSIIVLMPGKQGASIYGHVAVVESIVPNSNPITVVTSNMNWYANGGGFDIVSTVDFTVGPGVYFVWHP